MAMERRGERRPQRPGQRRSPPRESRRSPPRRRRSRSRSPPPRRSPPREPREREGRDRRSPPRRERSPPRRDRHGRSMREYSPEPARPRPPSIVSQYDSLFEGADWYNGLKPAADQKAGAEQKPGESAASAASAEAAAASSGSVAETPEEIAAQKQRMLEEFLGMLPAVGEPTGTPQADAAAEPEAAAKPAAPAPQSDSGGGSSHCVATASVAQTQVASPQASPGSQLVRSFMSGLAGASPATSNAPSGCQLDASLASAASPPPLPAPPSHAAVGADGLERRRRSGPRLRLHEMRTTHVVSCLRRLGLARYADAFEESKVDGYMCDFLDEELLELKLGVAEPEHRRIFLDWVEQMQRPGE